MMKLHISILCSAVAAMFLFCGFSELMAYPSFRPDGSPVRPREKVGSDAAVVDKQSDDSRRSGRADQRPGNQDRRKTTIVLPDKKNPSSSAKTAASQPARRKSGDDNYGYHPAPEAAEPALDNQNSDSQAPARSYRPGDERKTRKATTITYGRKKGPMVAQEEAELEAELKNAEDQPKPVAGKDRRGRNLKTEPTPVQPQEMRPVEGPERQSAARSQPGRKGRDKTAAAAPPAPAPPSPASSLVTEEEMARAYKAFDYAYENSLGKTRRELNDLWGFDLQRMGDNGEEVAYGFRQRGVLNLPEKKDRKGKTIAATHYSPGKFSSAGAPGKQFACLVILWVDKKGRGQVVDGDAVGDCFIVEALSQTPRNFER